MLAKEIKYQHQMEAYKDRIEKDHSRKRWSMISKAEKEKAILDDSLERTKAVIQWEYQWELDNLHAFCDSFLKESTSEELWERFDISLKETEPMISQPPSRDEGILVSMFMLPYGLAIMMCLGLIIKGVSQS